MTTETGSSRSSYQDGEYLRRNPSWHSEDSEWKANNVSRLLSDNSICPESIVDIGCGTGDVLSHLRASWPAARLVGWDVSTNVAEFWTKPTDEIELRLGDFRSESQHYDVALMLDVFEHVPDYMGILRDVATLAELFVFHIPLEMNISSVLRKRYLYSRQSVGHLHYFSAESAQATIIDTGYEIVDSRFTAGTRELASAKRPVTRVANLFRFGLERVGREYASTILGGYSLLVLAKSADS